MSKALSTNPGTLEESLWSSLPSSTNGIARLKKAVIINDIQIPFQDKVTLELVVRFIGELKPDWVIMNGDIVDCYTISEFSRDPLTTTSLAQEIREAGELMARFRDIPQKLWIGGNHEDRLRRFIWNKAPQLAEVEGLDFPGLFKLADHGFSWIEYGGHTMVGKLLVTHGDLVRRDSGATARAHFQKFGKSVMIGHTHRLGTYYKTQLGTPRSAFENGCLCSLTPEYANNVDWQQGFSVVHWCEETGYFHVQQMPIFSPQEGRPLFFYGDTQYGG